MTDLYTKKTLAIKLNISSATLNRWMKKGMPTIKIGGIVRFNIDEVEKWIYLTNYYNGEKLSE